MSYVAILLADGFEEVEALFPCDFLRRSDVDVKLLSVTEQKIVSGSHSISVVADMYLKDALAKDISTVIVPGGMPGSMNLADNNLVVQLVNNVYSSGGLIAAICASPVIVLPRTNFFSQKMFTCAPSQLDKIVDSTYYVEAPVVIDKKIITSRGPGTTAQFTYAIVRELKGKEVADKVFNQALFTYD